jgi:hypothetical protein
MQVIFCYCSSPLGGSGSGQYSDWLRAGRSRNRIPVRARFYAPVQTSPGAHPASCTMGTRSSPGVKSSRGVTPTPHPLLVPWSWKGRAIPLLPLMGRTACTEPQCLYKGDLYLYIFTSTLAVQLIREVFYSFIRWFRVLFLCCLESLWLKKLME